MLQNIRFNLMYRLTFYTVFHRQGSPVEFSRHGVLDFSTYKNGHLATKGISQSVFNLF